MTALIRHSAFLLMTALVGLVFLTPARAANLDRLEAFLEVTGFDVALESIRLSAENAPNMIGLEADDFGSEWTRLVEDVFDTEQMHGMALEILSQTLDDDLLTHAVDFYASDLGQRLVVAENASHMKEDEDLKTESGEAIVAGLVRIGSPRLEELKRLNKATGSEDASVRAIQEVQVRFLMAAASAGVIELRMEEADLRESLKAQEGELRRGMQMAGLSGSAYTYQAFSHADITAYADALEHPKMQRVYELMNAVQFEIMANRYEAVAQRMQSLQPSQDL
ncbi:DUF2059 domain-containing protein [Roseobacter sp. YSTF-M11]|uniref:DUF2059 domain-containing protein n=1 Tax=Roseobacter insulae TaxID=2859783 RepID=A0A9X1FUN5_9RHOB|nr:DUF2059 domain-containing protein [Roseobacter insulae]MBW4708260.1 DUF2059 domain-containing protein [Roseobacter insulae]